MNATAPAPLNPQIVGQAENVHVAVLARALAGTGITKNGWIALTLAATAGEAVEREQLLGRLTGALKTGQDAARAAVAELAAASLVTDVPGQADLIAVTEAGRELFGSVRAATAAIIARAYAGVPAEDLAVAARVLTAITAGLTRELAAARHPTSPERIEQP